MQFLAKRSTEAAGANRLAPAAQLIDMPRRTFIAILAVLSGCRSPATTTADFARFFVDEVTGRGGKVQPTDTLPRINGRWKIERDEFGFVINLYKADFQKVDRFLALVLGEPADSFPENIHGNPQRMYDTDISRMHIQMVGKPNKIYIVAIGPKKSSD